MIIAVLGVVLLAGGLVAAIEIAIAYSGRDPWVVPYNDWYRNVRTHDWQNHAARAVFILIAVTGLVLLVLQLLRRRPETLAVRSDSDVTYTIRRRSLEHSLTRSVEHFDGVESAAVKIGRQGVRVTARSHRRLPGDVKPSIEASVQSRLRVLQLEHPSSVRVNLRLRDKTS